MDKKFNEAVEEARREITDEKFNKAVEEERRRQTQDEKQGKPAPSQPTEDHHKTIAPNTKEEGHYYNPSRDDKDIPAWVQLLAEQVRLDCVPLYSDIPLCGETVISPHRHYIATYRYAEKTVRTTTLPEMPDWTIRMHRYIATYRYAEKTIRTTPLPETPM